MKILRIVYEWPPKWIGLAAAPYEMTASQVKLGHEVSVFCGRWPFSGPIEKIKNVKLYPFIREPISGTLLVTIAPLAFFYYLVWRLKNKVDVIHSHGHFAFYLYAYRYFLKKYFPHAKELKTPLIVHFHNTVKGRWERMKERKVGIKPISKYLSWPLSQKSDEYAVDVADACIFVSEGIMNEAIRYYKANPAKCFIVETGVNASLFFPIGPEETHKTRKELGLDMGDKVMLHCGHVVERKNVHLLIEALEHLPHVYKLLIVGAESDPAYESRLRDMISKKSIEDRVVRVGNTPYPQVPIAYQASNILVLPSGWEGLPKTVMESLACGVPVLASGFKAKEEIAGLKYLKELSAKEIAVQVQQIVEGNTKVDLGKVRSYYSWDTMARKVDSIYSKVLVGK